MRVKTLLILTAIVSSALGAVAVYFALSVPNDLEADAMLRQARQHLSAGKMEQARKALSDVMQQYPRTNAAGAANAALARLAYEDNRKLATEVETLRKETQRQQTTIGGLQKTVEELKKAPPKTVVVQAPPPKPPPKKKAPAKKPTPTRRRRR